MIATRLFLVRHGATQLTAEDRPVRARLMLFNDVSHYADHPRDPAQCLSRWWDK